jgi:hypothetical protein
MYRNKNKVLLHFTKKSEPGDISCKYWAIEYAGKCYAVPQPSANGFDEIKDTIFQVNSLGASAPLLPKRITNVSPCLLERMAEPDLWQLKERGKFDF